MALYSWTTAPPQILEQVQRVVDAIALGEELAGLYLHGSLAMGCFNPDRSDVDLLAVTKRPLSLDVKKRLAKLLPEHSCQPAPLEISFVTQQALTEWVFPPPYEFHYSEAWRGRIEDQVTAGYRTDPDLAAHLTIVQERGVVLSGLPIAQVFQPIPPADYLAAIWDHDGKEAAARIQSDPIYGVLNLCRILAYVIEGHIQSKLEGGHWALATLPTRFAPVIGHAVGIYSNQAEGEQFDPEELQSFADYMRTRITGDLSRRLL